jgi:hypothetical protein
MSTIVGGREGSENEGVQGRTMGAVFVALSRSFTAGSWHPLFPKFTYGSNMPDSTLA